jgi:hypothetical protein
MATVASLLDAKVARLFNSSFDILTPFASKRLFNFSGNEKAKKRRDALSAHNEINTSFVPWWFNVSSGIRG